MDSKYFTMLARPSARLLQEREAIDVDMPCIIQAAREHSCFVELNSQPVRLDLTETNCHMAKEQGVLVSVNSNGHNTQGFDLLRNGINQA